MMYNNKMACAIKVDSSVLKEHEDKVIIPFNSEFSVFIKNLNTKKAIVNISIDGTDISKGGIVVNANSSVDIERFVTNNDRGNRFKFIERTAGVENSRGVGVEDGLIRVEFQFEKESRPIIQWGPEYTHYETSTRPPDQWKMPDDTTGNPPDRMVVHTNSILRGSSFNANSIPQEVTLQSNDAGITVPGSISEQKFKEVEDFPLEAEKHVMILKLVGVHNDKPVKAVTPTRQKQKCVTCKRVNKASAKFCTECGTSLIVI